jgi:chromosome segregation ATPase
LLRFRGARTPADAASIVSFERFDAAPGSALLRVALRLRQEGELEGLQLVLQRSGEELVRLDPLPAPPVAGETQHVAFGSDAGVASLADEFRLELGDASVNLPNPEALAAAPVGGFARSASGEREPAAGRDEEIEELKRTIYRYHLARREAEAEAATARERQAEAEREREAGVDERTLLADELAAARGEVERLSAEHEAGRSSGVEVQARLEEASAAVARLEKDLAAVRAEQAQQVGAAADRIGALEVERDELTGERDSLARDCDASAERVVQLDGQIEKLSAERDLLVDEADEARAARDRLEAELAAASEGMAAAGRARELEATVTQLEQQLAAVRDQAERLQQEITALRAREATLRSEAARSQAELTAAAGSYAADLDELRVELYAAHDRIAELDAALALVRPDAEAGASDPGYSG